MIRIVACISFRAFTNFHRMRIESCHAWLLFPIEIPASSTRERVRAPRLSHIARPATTTSISDGQVGGRLVDIGHWALRARIWTRSSVQQRLGNLVRVREDERGGEVPVIQIPLAPMTLFQSTLTALPPPNRSVTLVDTAIIVPSLSPVISALGKTKKNNNAASTLHFLPCVYFCSFPCSITVHSTRNNVVQERTSEPGPPSEQGLVVEFPQGRQITNIKVSTRSG